MCHERRGISNRASNGPLSPSCCVALHCVVYMGGQEGMDMESLRCNVRGATAELTATPPVSKPGNKLNQKLAVSRPRSRSLSSVMSEVKAPTRSRGGPSHTPPDGRSAVTRSDGGSKLQAIEAAFFFNGEKQGRNSRKEKKKMRMTSFSSRGSMSPSPPGVKHPDLQQAC